MSGKVTQYPLSEPEHAVQSAERMTTTGATPPHTPPSPIGYDNTPSAQHTKNALHSSQWYFQAHPVDLPWAFSVYRSWCTSVEGIVINAWLVCCGVMLVLIGRTCYG